MNITELARILKITPQELREKLPQIGFDIGQRAIKVDNRTAQKIIKGWSRLIRQLERELAEKNKKEEKELDTEENKKTIKIPQFITVRDFATVAQISVSQVLKELMKNGIFTSMNEKIDFDTAAVIGADLGLEVLLDEDYEHEDVGEKNKLTEILEKETKKELKDRPPVIVVMGHVDHGKTKLLDTIRKTDVVEGETGGITQHIGAYQVTRKKKKITFIDTPGHEAFTAMRSRGAKVADVAILIVAADDGVKPQTVEAFRIIEAAKIPFLVAINKIDKPDADVNRTKQELSSKLNIVPEDWGGKTVCVEISAKEGTGVDELLDTILLINDTEAENIKSNPGATAVGTVIESHVDKSAGPVSTILIQNGTLRVGEQLCFDGNIYGRVRALKNHRGEDIKEAGPSTPAMILGLKISPQVGDMLEVGEGKKIKIKEIKYKAKDNFAQKISKEEDDDKVKKFNLIIKSDVLGSAEAVEESLAKIGTADIKVKIINKGLGNIAEGDIKRAEDSDAQIVGFNVKVVPQVENLIREKNIKVNTFGIIYDLIDYVKNEMQELIDPETERVDLGRLKVLAIFRTENDNQIVGGKVLDGQVEMDSMIEVIRNKEFITEGKLVKLQAGKQDVNLVEKDEECGIKYEGKPWIEEGDILQFYKEKKIVKEL